MGSVLSTAATGRPNAANDVVSESETMSDVGASASTDNERSEEFHDAVNDTDDERVKAKEDAMVEFRNELQTKREQRKAILARHRNEKEELEKSLAQERKANLDLCESNRRLRELLSQNGIQIPQEINSTIEDTEISSVLVSMNEELEKLKSNNMKLRKDLVEANSTLQEAYSDIADLNERNTESIKHIKALKEVISVSKTMIGLREQQLEALKNKLSEIEQSLADREANLLSTDLRDEYVRQLQNIRTLRGLYEERARLAEVTRQSILRELEEQKTYNQIEIDKSNELKTRIEALETEIASLKEAIDSKNEHISSLEDTTRILQAEMSVVNKLFSQVLLGYKNKKDLDTLVCRLEENHGLLTHLAENENDSEASSALPKLLLEIVSQIEDAEEKRPTPTPLPTENTDTVKSASTSSSDVDGNAGPQINATAEEIVENLPKVWRVLIELLSHQSVAETNNDNEKVTTCYKSVETKSGPVLVPSVSQTYIRLKELILEKLALIREVNRMKQLNGHLESRLGVQEKRLCLVTTELSKTWHVVGRLRRHHHQLHTHEKILKYELQQKRKLLNELKDELKYCRERWNEAREKNLQSEKDCKQLRAEFSSRKSTAASCNHSAESGYSDEKLTDDSSDSNDDSEPIMRCKKKMAAKSFETIHDSSSEVHVAEREDPVSDMLDVADLPLDSHGGDENQESSISECLVSEGIVRNDNNYVETEDEALEITTDETVTQSNTNSIPTDTSLNKVITINPAEILESIRRQNERLAKRDKKLEQLERSGEALLKQTQGTVKLGEALNNTLDHILNRPSTSREETLITPSEKTKVENNNKRNEKPEVSSCVDQQLELKVENIPDNRTNDDKQQANFEVSDVDQNPSCSENIHMENVTDDLTHQNKFDSENDEQAPNKDSCPRDLPKLEYNSSITMPTIDPKAILESIRKQNERLAKKDERLSKMEGECSDVVKKISGTLDKGGAILKKIDTMHSEVEQKNNIVDVDETKSLPNEVGPSTSTGEVDHEARLAARDLRLTRLEEQTKSLVSKMNKTTSKGVKIHYKLEELHNIYGSENSRASTPADSTEDNSEGKEEVDKPEQTEGDEEDTA
ncbi:early endosome antigen 1 isoform X2 [Plutella xylostella]|uniref:early endosome antigen 1 isoform X2 n=1 Tax=Plutella xylostella TaxID=51655 RepID=UPI002032465E|nr:early endosome antigen 1 isoform X2 [Plutella xylostella]